MNDDAKNPTDTGSSNPEVPVFSAASQPEMTPSLPPEPRRERRSLAAIACSVIFILIGLAVFGAAWGVAVSIWTLLLLILGASGLALLVTALTENRR